MNGTILKLRPFGPNRPEHGFKSTLAVDTVEEQVEIRNLSLEEAQAMVDDGRGNYYVEKLTILELPNGEAVDLLLNEEGKLVGLDPSLLLLREGEVVDTVVGNVAFVKATADGHWTALSESELELVHGRIHPALAGLTIPSMGTVEVLFIPALHLGE